MIYGVLALGAVLLWIAWTYNRLVRQRNVVAEAWSGIEVQLKRRHDLVPNLASAVRAYGTHESGLFERVAGLRSQAQAASGPAAAVQPENELGAGLQQLLVLAEAYPELKAGANFLQLSRELVEIEDQLQYARRYFNGAVRDLNNLVESFPGSMVARRLGFATASPFNLESAAERQTPEVRL
jgi:LemA protein